MSGEKVLLFRNDLVVTETMREVWKELRADGYTI